MLSHPPLSPLRGGCDITRARPYSPLYPSYSECSVCVTLCVVVCNNHSRAPIYGGYLPQKGTNCGACCAPCAVSACCTGHMCWLYVVLRMHLCVGYMRCLECTHVLAICGASTPMCWLYVLWGAWRAPGARGEWPL